MSLTLTAASAGDLDAIMILERAGFDHGRWSRESWAAELDRDDRHVTVATSAGEVAGVATFSLLGGDAELLRVITAPGQRRRGIGRALVRDGLAWARGAGAERILLEVEDGNAAAAGLYASLGFATITRRAGYYGAGRDALIMEKTIMERGLAS